MKTYTIGRENSCHIVLQNNTISRRHAILRVHGGGKMDIIDQSQNGTFVNGVRTPVNIPFPVKRKDVVTFANTEKLNWKQIPNPLAWVTYTVWGLVAAMLIAGGVLLYLNLKPEPTIQDEDIQQPVKVEKKGKKDAAKDADKKSGEEGEDVFRLLHGAEARTRACKEGTACQDRAVQEQPEACRDKHEEGAERNDAQEGSRSEGQGRFVT